MLQRHGLLDPKHKLVYGNPVPIDPLWEGIYLDDLLITLKVSMPEDIPLDGSFVPPEPQAMDIDLVHTKKAETAYEEARLPRALHKSFRAETRFKAWGAEIDGILGRVGAPLDVRRELWWLLAQTIASGRVSKEILEKLGGFIAFVFQFRRELFSLLHHFYVFSSKLDAHKTVRLPGYIADELRSVALHLPVAFWSMRKRLSTSLLATDATPSSGGAVRAVVPDALAEELWRRSEVRGAPVRLEPETDHALVAPPLETSKFAASIAPCLEWQVVGSYSFRKTYHINLQEARALKREVCRLSSDPANIGSIQVALNDSMVVVGAVCKGRSSSFRLNGILRSQLPFLAFADISLALLWVETAANLADWPSRFRSLPPPVSPRAWMAKFGLAVHSWIVGWEIFSGSGRITAAYIDQGWEMLPPVDILLGLDALASWLDRVIDEGKVTWIWLAPPCGSFSPLRNLDLGGPLRPRGFPEGDEAIPEIARGNLLWRRALHLAQKILDRGGSFVVEHPRSSKAWHLRETELFLKNEGVTKHAVDWCAYHVGPDLPVQKPTTLMSNFGWLKGFLKRCPRDHVHGPPLRGKRAREAGAYPKKFCQEFAAAHAAWWRSPSTAQPGGSIL